MPWSLSHPLTCAAYCDVDFYVVDLDFYEVDLDRVLDLYDDANEFYDGVLRFYDDAFHRFCCHLISQSARKPPCCGGVAHYSRRYWMVANCNLCCHGDRKLGSLFCVTGDGVDDGCAPGSVFASCLQKRRLFRCLCIRMINDLP